MHSTSIISTARALSETFAKMRELGINDRRLFDSILRETLAQNPQYLGVWTVWEPNALDGRDREFANAPGHDRTGRFIPLWNRAGGIHVEPNVGYDVPGFGDWYLIPMRRRAETVMDPYEFSFGGASGVHHQPGGADFFPGRMRRRDGRRRGAAGPQPARGERAGGDAATRLHLPECHRRGAILEHAHPGFAGALHRLPAGAGAARLHRRPRGAPAPYWRSRGVASAAAGGGGAAAEVRAASAGPGLSHYAGGSRRGVARGELDARASARCWSGSGKARPTRRSGSSSASACIP